MYDEETQNHTRTTGSQAPSPPDWYYSDTPQQCIHDAAERIVAAHFREVDQARFMRTGGHRRYRVKGVDARVALAGTLAVCFNIDAGERAETLWWALSNNYLNLSDVERGAVALLTRKNELLDTVRSVKALMLTIEFEARTLFEDAMSGRSNGS